VPFTLGFDPRLRGEHFDNHATDLGATTEEEYEALADAFIGGPLSENTKECKRSNGDKIRYNFRTEEYGVLSGDGYIRTYFKPKPRIHRHRTNFIYFKSECKK